MLISLFLLKLFTLIIFHPLGMWGNNNSKTKTFLPFERQFGSPSHWVLGGKLSLLPIPTYNMTFFSLHLNTETCKTQSLFLPTTCINFYILWLKGLNGKINFHELTNILNDLTHLTYNSISMYLKTKQKKLCIDTWSSTI